MVVPFSNYRVRVSFAFLAVLIATAFMAIAPFAAWAQSATSGSVSGVIVDPSNAVIVGAKITLQSHATNAIQTATTDATGRYSFPVVAPGDYTLTVTQSGFQTQVVAAVHVDVSTSSTYNFTMKVGQQSQTIEVTSVPGAELQTTNASIGTTIGTTMIENLPTVQRNVSSLLGLQPAVAPMTTSDVMGGGVAGAQADQTTFIVDGGDATSDMEGTNSYAGIPGEVEPAPFIQVGVESTSEFRVVDAGPTSNLNRSQGGQVSIVSKSGTNTFHGSGYEFYEGAALNANSWENNWLGIDRPGQVNNRFGFTLGGPILKNRLWFFGNYEARRYRQSTEVQTDVPTATARQGILRFESCTNGVDSSGNCIGPENSLAVSSYNLASSTACGPSGGVACDPRSVGIDPLIQKYWALEPLPNTPGVGDSCGSSLGCLNSEGFTQEYAEPDNEEYGLGRLDFKINDRWTLFATMREQKIDYFTGDQFSIIPGDQDLLSSTPVHPRFATFGLTGAIGSSFTNEAHGDYMVDAWGWLRAGVDNPSGITGIGGVLQVSGEGQTGGGSAGKPWADPVNFNTQNGRARSWDGRDWYLADDASWLHGNHTITFGGSWYFWNIIHQRTDDVLGGLAGNDIYWVGSKQMSSGEYVDIKEPASEMPPACSGTIIANCLQSADIGRWFSEYAAMLGLVDHSSQIATTNGQFQLNPLGTPATDHVHIGSFYLYTGDEWHVKPTVTITYGLSYGVQGPPRELNGEQVMQEYAATSVPITNIPEYFAQRQASLDRGNPYPSLNDFTNPSFQFVPVGATGRSSSLNTYWGALGPHVAVAWQVPWQNRIFGNNHNTVIRAGYTLQWNRTNAVGLVLTPLLGDGLMQIVGCNAPNIAGTCTGGSTPMDASNAFRIGEDGNSLPPPVGVPGYPLVPTSPFSSPYGFNLAPNLVPPYSHNFTFDLQRSFAHNWLIDVGYIGRYVHDLEAGGDINASDMFAKDPVSGQTLAQAFQAVSNWARAGGSCNSTATSCPGLSVQPFFEDMAVPGGSATAGSHYCQNTYGTSCTYEAAASDASDAQNGSLGGFMEFNYDFLASAPLDPMQFEFNFWNWFNGYSNYNAGFVTVKKALSQGLNLSASWTWSHAMGTQALGQQYIIYGNPSPFLPSTGYTDLTFDYRNVGNVAFYYVLPFGKGQRFAPSNNILNRVIGGWWLSGIYTVQSGEPLCIGADGDYGDIGAGAINASCASTNLDINSLKGAHYGQGPSGINMFADPTAVYNSLSRPSLTQTLRPYTFTGSGFPLWNLDMSLGKNVLNTERIKGMFTVDAFDIFNAMIPANPSLDMNNPGGFGVVTSQGNNPRQLQLGLHITF
jgi:Carboxypeptidase regulatory-like domain